MGPTRERGEDRRHVRRKTCRLGSWDLIVVRHVEAAAEQYGVVAAGVRERRSRTAKIRMRLPLGFASVGVRSGAPSLRSQARGEFLCQNDYGILWISYVVVGVVGADVAAITAVAAVAADGEVGGGGSGAELHVHHQTMSSV